VTQLEEVREVQAGAGACAILSEPGSGQVVATFLRACYIRFNGGLVAVTDELAPRGPLHIRLPSIPPMRMGDEVRVNARRVLDLGEVSILPTHPGWIGARPSRHFLSAAHPTADLALAATELPELLADPYQAARLQTVIEHGRLSTLARLVGGLGPGLTPAGDDLLAGVLLVACLAAPTSSERAQLVEVASSVRTNDIALAFLAWAARGQSIEPAHDFLAASAHGDQARANSAVSELLRFGQTSGHALAHGIALALRSLPSLRSREA
jgi:hypothetical protein